MMYESACPRDIQGHISRAKVTGAEGFRDRFLLTKLSMEYYLGIKWVDFWATTLATFRVARVLSQVASYLRPS